MAKKQINEEKLMIAEDIFKSFIRTQTYINKILLEDMLLTKVELMNIQKKLSEKKITQ